jgi:hypothetical protein
MLWVMEGSTHVGTAVKQKRVGIRLGALRRDKLDRILGSRVIIHHHRPAEEQQRPPAPEDGGQQDHGRQDTDPENEASAAPKA